MPILTPEADAHYVGGIEQGRLAIGTGRLEAARVQDLLVRTLPGAPAVVLDVGGAAGVHALWMADRGYEVHLVDAVDLHVAQARAASAAAARPLASATVGDARALDRPDASVDAVVLLGPLYHLVERDDRLRALREARRVLVPGGVLLAGTVSRFASLLDGLRRDRLGDPVFRDIVTQDLRDGQHRNPTGHPQYFTTTFFHHPDELRAELVEAGFTVERVVATEGPAWLAGNFEAIWVDPVQRAWLLDTLRSVEDDPALVGASAHPIGVARR